MGSSVSTERVMEASYMSTEGQFDHKKIEAL